MWYLLFPQNIFQFYSNFFMWSLSTFDVLVFILNASVPFSHSSIIEILRSQNIQNTTFYFFIYLFSKHFIYLTTLTQSPQETNALKAIGLTFWEGLRQRCIQGHPRTMCLYWTAVGTRASSVGLLCSVMGISLSSVWSCCSSAWEQGIFPEHLAFQHKATEAICPKYRWLYEVGI